MKVFLYLSLILLLGCTSKNEQEAISELSNRYGGGVTISNGVSSSTTDGSFTYKKIEVSNSGAIEEGVIEPEILASNYALSIFNKLDSAERDFDWLNVDLNKSDGTIYTYKIKRQELENVEKGYKFIFKWIEEVKRKNIEESYTFLKSNHPALPTKEIYLKTFNDLSEKYGDIDSVMLNGFVFEKVPDPAVEGGELLQLIWTFNTIKGIYAIYTYVNLKDPDYKIYSIVLDAD